MKEEALRHSLSEIEKAGEEADAIVDRVRNFVKGKESAHVPLDLTSEVNRTVETFRRHTDSPITVTVPWSPTLIVCGDPVELGIIFMNLLRNAETATSKNDPGHPPRITITMRREGERAVAEALGTREINPEGRSRSRAWDHEGTRGGARRLDQIRAPL